MILIQLRHLLLVLVLPIAMVFEDNNAMNTAGYTPGDSLGLRYLMRPAKDSTQPAPVLILLHGYGSNENDLFSFSDRIPEEWLVVSVRAPLAVSGNQFKWYNAQLVGKKIAIDSEAESKSRQLLLQLVDQLIEKNLTIEGQVVVAGFSQGANMAVNLAVTGPEKILAAGCFSGRFLEEIRPLIKNKGALKAKKVFIAHGTEDQMLPLRYAEENQKVLQGFGMDITMTTDKIPHSISSKELDEFVKWLNTLKNPK